MGKNLSCTFSTDNEQGQTSGTVYIAGEHMRGDFTNNNPNSGTLTSTMIKEGDWMYSWTSSSNQGVKMKFSEIEASTDTKANQYVDPSQQVDYDCKPWTVDRAIFTPPTNITFTDVASQMMEAQEKSKEFRNSQCVACDSLEGEAKAACLKTLDCQ